MAFPKDTPVRQNTFLEDDLLQSYLKRFFSQKDFEEISKDLTRFGKRCMNELDQLSQAAEKFPPQLVKNKVVVHSSWKKLNSISASEGIVAIGYERKFGALSRLYQHSKNYLFHPVSAYYTCPLAMTDGAAKLLEIYGDEELKQKAYKNLISRDPKKFWTSGQWMTERNGGSDVSQSETLAKLNKGQWKLYGEKFFTSAITSQMAMTLARVVDEKGQTVPGNKGLSLFYLEVNSGPQKINQIKVLKLKNKLGTKALPTAELRLNGTKAKLVGQIGEGVRSISSLFNISRIDNALAAIGTARHMIALAYDYANKRVAFGKRLIDHPLHAETLFETEVEFHGAFHITFFVSRLLGETECVNENRASLLRLLTPIAKLSTAKQNLKITSELLESFGGAGYMEDSNIPVHLRNSQTLSIWEGTTNILSLDVLRALQKEQSLKIFAENVRERMNTISSTSLVEAKNSVLNFLSSTEMKLIQLMKQSLPTQEKQARKVALSLARVMMASLIVEHAEFTQNEKYVLIAQHWCQTKLYEKI